MKPAAAVLEFKKPEKYKTEQELFEESLRPPCTPERAIGLLRMLKTYEAVIKNMQDSRRQCLVELGLDPEVWGL